MNYEVKEVGGRTDEDLANHHVEIRKRFPLFRGLSKAIAAPAAQPKPEPKKKGYAVVEGKLNGGHVERFELHRVSPLRFKLVRETNQAEWYVEPAVLSRAVDTARTTKSEVVTLTVYGDEFALTRKQFKPGLRFLLGQM